MSQMPEIKPEVNKEPEREKKKSGLLGRLFGGGAGGTAAGGAGLGGFGGAAAGGGLLATKAGLMALILVGTTVAGGIGMVGYRLFGPGQDQGTSDNLQLFAPKPKEATSADLQAAPKDGTSQSLTFASEANSQSKAAALTPAEAPKDATAAGSASSAESVASSHGQINANDNLGSGVNKHLLKGSGKFGALSSAFGGGSGSGGGSYSAGGTGKTGPAADAIAASARNGASGAMGVGHSAMGGGRAMVGRRAGKPMAQAFSALRDGRSAATSFAAGRTFDGSAANVGGTIGPEGGNIGMGGPGTADGGAPKSLPANANSDKKEFKAPPTPSSKMAAPWQNAINTAQMMLTVGALLLFAMSKVTIPGLRYAIGAVVLAMGVAIVALGGKISGGEWGQKVQGGVLAAAGLGLSAAAVMAMISTSDNTHGTDKNGDFIKKDGAFVDPGTNGSVGSSVDTGAEKDVMFGMNPYVLLGGGSALIAVATCQMKPPVKHPSSDFENGKPPDANWFGYRQLPSETALKKMIA